MDIKEQIKALESAVKAAVDNGLADVDVARLWEKILNLDPNHATALLLTGQRAFRAGQLERARDLFERLVKVDGKDQQEWINLAVVCQAQGDLDGEDAAITGALTVAPSDLLGLLMRGDLRERQDRPHEAAKAYASAAIVAPALDALHPNLRPAVQRAIEKSERYNERLGSFIDDYMAQAYQDLPGAASGRFRESVDLMLGRKRRFDAMPTNYYFPGLAPTNFFDRAQFPWIEALEAQTDAIRAELLQALAADTGFEPYLTYSADQPHNQFAELNNSLRWSVLHLLKDGERVELNAGRCPATMAALAGLPQPQQPGRTPNAMFSLLKPHTRIPAHVGVSNARLVVHLPLIVPPNCGFRVGNDVIAWEEGKAIVFDDTIEHEAWNDSDELRVVLIFDIWHPHLSEAERALISAMSKGINAFTGDAGGFEL